MSTQSSSQTFTDALATRVLDFWFGDAPLHPTIEQAQKWFRPNQSFDDSCRSGFSEAITKLTETPTSDLLALATTPERTLALLLLLDQLPRNIHRGPDSAHVYTVTDPLALSVARHAIAPDRRFDLGPDKAWRTVPTHRAWFYLPLEHSEDLAAHALAKDMADECIQDCKGGPGEEMAVGMEKFLKEHTDVLELFGRYPYRNAVLGRETTEKEKAWLEAGSVAWAR